MLTNQVLETVLGILHIEIHKSRPGFFSSLHFSDQNFINIFVQTVHGLVNEWDVVFYTPSLAGSSSSLFGGRGSQYVF